MDLELTENAPQANHNNLSLPEVITVRVPADDFLEGNTSRDIVVEIENLPIVKPFLGGHIDKVTKLEYHDAYTQTGPPFERIKFDGILSRDTQTVEVKTVEVDTPLDQAVAVYGEAVEKTFATRLTDRVIQPGPYETYEEMSKRINFVGKVTMIQRNLRRYRWQELIRESAAEWRRLQQEQIRREEKRIKVHSDGYRKECIVKTFPKTKEDFDALYAQIQHWKENELKLICEKYSGAPKIAEMNILLDKEVQLLNGIERQRQLLKQEIRKQRNEQKLKNMGDPIKWIGYKELIIQMDTLRNQRARYLGSYYQKLSDEDLKNNDRIELLNQVSEVLTNEDHPAIGELETLLQRERQLLLCKVDESSMDLLRKRQLILMMDIIQYDKFKQEKKHEQPTRLCKKCSTVQPIRRFPLDTRQKSASVCERCTDLHGPAVDISIYRSILRSIRRDEKKRAAPSSYAFIIQDTDIRYIVENIWHGHSAISSETIRAELRLPRWNASKDWTPWNCICLTESEARAHLKIVNLSNYYEESIIKDIENKHALARSGFRQLREIDQAFVESGTWWNAGLCEKTV
ncbi:IQ and ubiquitin-like domain-containing protein [Uranotaenia lowii]|uniref:IQ and ubiquitin-like domain-containing protein n=1 Tax=Uranotaenia lowii TaxID=190385 RepID=UPI00247A884D|nr:IQ and ubiquitin-like domain-containing protein [Uranotaenia lowii]